VFDSCRKDPVLLWCSHFFSDLPAICSIRHVHSVALVGFPTFFFLDNGSAPSQVPSFASFSRPSSSHGSELTLIKPLRLSRTTTRPRDAFKDMEEKVSSLPVAKDSTRHCEITQAVFLIKLFPDLTTYLPPLSHQPFLVMGPSRMLFVFGFAIMALPLTRMVQSTIGAPA
jgi:hypothetical protein